jgi:rhodanese-related sulfurtransferase
MKFSKPIFTVMKKIIMLVIGLFLVITSCNRINQYNAAEDMVAEALKMVKMITVEELNQLMESEEIYTLIDVRQKSEHYFGYIPGSLVIPRGSLEFLIGSEEFWENEGLYMPLKEEKIVVYCKKGSRGILAAESLIKLGYKDVVALEGGWKKWELSYPDIYEKNLEMLSGGGAQEHDDGGGC